MTFIHLTRSAGDGATTRQPVVGDTVRIGSGKNQWRVAGFWMHGDTTMADLVNPEKPWVRTSSVTGRLTLVQGGGA